MLFIKCWFLAVVLLHDQSSFEHHPHFHYYKVSENYTSCAALQELFDAESNIFNPVASKCVELELHGNRWIPVGQKDDYNVADVWGNLHSTTQEQWQSVPSITVKIGGKQ